MTDQPIAVAITTNTLGAGGAERQRVLLANALLEEGAEATLVVLQELGQLADEVDPRVRIERRAYQTGSSRRHDLLITGTTRTEIGFALAAAARRRTGRWAVAVHNPVGPGAPLLTRFAYAGCLAAGDLVALTPQHADRISRYWGLRPSAVISNAIDPARFATLPAPTSEFAAGFIGRLDAHHKGLDRLLHAVADSTAPFTLAIAGVGPDEGDLRRLADDLGISDRVSWLGYVPPEEFLPRIGALCVLSRFEAQPLVILEADAAGVPVVSSLEAGAAGAVDADRPDLVAAAVRAASGRPRSSVSAARTPRDMAQEYLDLLHENRRPRRIADARAGAQALWRGRAPLPNAVGA
ncbi:glycosyltransferase [Pseudolysinimonas sp.]|jgi:glycosyltransferase involved in cell wall biosynthesis|uniref:glycosyltransferase n=1 Tax=Pseudolysinimonas sp. TaxID=2680009 RepID=UPI0037837ABA